MGCIWLDISHRPWVPEYRLPRRTDVAILGGGLGGLLTAYLLGEVGIDCTVIEAGRVGDGASGRSTGKVTLQRGLFYHNLMHTAGRGGSRAFVEACQDAILSYDEMAKVLSLEDATESAPAILYTQRNVGILEREAQATRALGIKAELERTCELPFPISLALSVKDQRKINPLLWLYRLLEEVKVVENTKVLRVEGHTIHTDHGECHAESIVFCTHYPLLSFSGLHHLILTQKRSYSIALRGALHPMQGMYYGIDKNGMSILHTAGHLLLCGGGHKTGDAPDDPYYKLRRTARAYFPQGEVVAKWSAQDVMSPDGLPLIGKYSALTPNWYLMTGHSKWGLLTSMLGAKMLTRRILGYSTPLDSLLSPQRWHGAEMRAGGEVLRSALRGYKRRYLTPAVELSCEIPHDYGKVVTRGGVKMGIYRDESGKEWAIKPVCTHLGCALNWNGITKSWDCPCHGSRFDYTGKPIDNPAIRPLERLDPQTGHKLKEK